MEQESTIKRTAEGQIDYDQLAEALADDHDLAMPEDMYDAIEVRQLNDAIARRRHQSQKAEMWSAFGNVDPYSRVHSVGVSSFDWAMKGMIIALIVSVVIIIAALVVEQAVR